MQGATRSEPAKVSIGTASRKGSHGELYVGSHRTIVKYGKIKLGLFHAMLKQLNIRKEDF